MMKRALVVAIVTGVLGGAAIGSPAIAATGHDGPSLCLMDSPEC